MHVAQPDAAVRAYLNSDLFEATVLATVASEVLPTEDPCLVAISYDGGSVEPRKYFDGSALNRHLQRRADVLLNNYANDHMYVVETGTGNVR